MKTINIATDSSVTEVPIMIPFLAAPHDDFTDGEEVLIQLVNQDGEKVGYPQVRSVIQTHSAEDNHNAWYEAFIPRRK